MSNRRFLDRLQPPVRLGSDQQPSRDLLLCSDGEEPPGHGKSWQARGQIAGRGLHKLHLHGRRGTGRRSPRSGFGGSWWWTPLAPTDLVTVGDGRWRRGRCDEKTCVSSASTSQRKWSLIFFICTVQCPKKYSTFFFTLYVLYILIIILPLPPCNINQRNIKINNFNNNLSQGKYFYL